MTTVRFAELNQSSTHLARRMPQCPSSVLIALGTSTLLAVATPATSAWAQTSAPGNPAASQGAATGTGQLMAQNVASDRRRMEEIVVTARKRQERIEDVPISLSVIGTDEIDRRGLLDAEFLRGIPGVNQITERLGQTIVIRGLETSPSAQNFSSGVSVRPTSVKRDEHTAGPTGAAIGHRAHGRRHP